MSNVRVQLNLAGINELLTSDPIQKAVDEAAWGIVAVAGPGFEMVSRGRFKGHPWTSRAYAQTADIRGIKRESREQALSRAVGGSG